MFAFNVKAEIIPNSHSQIQRFKSKQGSWAVVTGASDGIGKEFALQLAKHGFNIYLIARNPQLLSETASAISNSITLQYPMH